MEFEQAPSFLSEPARQRGEERIVVAADGPNDVRNHPLFSASISDH
jgi:hypothetical protein